MAHKFDYFSHRYIYENTKGQYGLNTDVDVKSIQVHVWTKSYK